MAADDFMESEVAIAAAATAALFSPRVREVVRKGAVYGMAGALTAGRAVAGVAREAGRGVGSVMPSPRPARGAAASNSSSRSRTAGGTRRPRSAGTAAKSSGRSSNRSGGTRRSGNTASSGSGSRASSASS
jgi:hypothetical protein